MPDAKTADVNLDPQPEAAAPAAAAPEAAAAKTPAKKKDPLPDGWVTPTALAKLFTPELRPQVVYGYQKNGKDFPFKHHTDGRVIVPVDDAKKWIEDRLAKSAERKAAKAAKEATDAAAAEAAKNTPADATASK